MDIGEGQREYQVEPIELPVEIPEPATAPDREEVPV